MVMAGICVVEGGKTLEKANASYIQAREIHMLGESTMGEIGMYIFKRGLSIFKLVLENRHGSKTIP